MRLPSRRRVAPAPDEGAAAAADAARSRLARLAATQHDHLEDGLRDARGRLGLDVLVAARGRLSAGEVVTVLVPVARAVHALHEQRVSFGGVGPTDVVLDGTGRPSLRRCLQPGEGARTQVERDVRSLAELGWLLLTGQALAERVAGQVPDLPTPLVALLLAVVDAPEGEGPSGTQLADDLFAACPPVPVHIPEALRPRAVVPDRSPDERPDPADVSSLRFRGEPARPPASRRGARKRGPGRRRAPRAGGVRGLRTRRGTALAVLATGVALLLLRSYDSPATARTTEAPPAASLALPPQPQPEPVAREPWAEVVERLDRLRSDAYAAGSEQALDEAYAPASPALERDRALLATYLRAGARAEGLLTPVVSAREVSSGADEAVLHVTDRMPAYVLRLRDGTPVARPGRATRSWTFVLRRHSGSWRTWEVTARP